MDDDEWLSVATNGIRPPLLAGRDPRDHVENLGRMSGVRRQDPKVATFTTRELDLPPGRDESPSRTRYRRHDARTARSGHAV